MDFDLIITGGMVVDGAGRRPPFPADVGVIGDRIAAVDDLSAAAAARRIDARGRIVSPGFIDVHVHAELALLGETDQLAGARQGVTTQLTSPDGFGWAPLPVDLARELFDYTKFAYGDTSLPAGVTSIGAYLETFAGRIPINLYPQVPHCAVRLRAMGWASRRATPAELSAMGSLVRAWMEAGAGALCIGLDYQPSAHADLRELVSLARIAAEYGGIYAAHVRSQELGKEGAWQETAQIAAQAHIPVHISHSRVDEGTSYFLDQADRQGLDLTFDAYLYPAGMTHLALFLPLDVQAGSLSDMLHRMRDPQVRARALPHLRQELDEIGDPIVGYTASGRWIGESLSTIATRTGQAAVSAAYDLILEEDGVEVFVIPWLEPEDEIETILERTAVQSRLMIASDGIYHIPHPHPRSYGCFAQVLRRFVRELPLLSLPEAIYKMSGFPARRFGLANRGQIGRGFAADLVVFDLSTISDQATWTAPRRPATGVEWVLVNGEPVIAAGQPTGRRPGRILKHK